jgi:hypothetical protein
VSVRGDTMVFDMSWFGALPGPAPHPRLSRVSRWSAPHPWDAFVAGSCSYFCFGGPIVVFLLLLAPFLFLPFMLFLPLVLTGYWTLEAAWFVHRWYLRYRQEPYTDPPPNPDRRKHMERFLRLREDCIPDFRAYLARWFRGADPRSIRRENVREFVRYGFYGKVDGPLSDESEAEIEWWLGEVERVWAIKIPEGRAQGLRFMRHMREPLRTFHQPLLVVAYSHMAESFAGVVLRCWGFKHRACGDTGVTYWLRGGEKEKKENAHPRRGRASRRGSRAPSRDASAGPSPTHALSSLEAESVHRHRNPENVLENDADLRESENRESGEAFYCRECGDDGGHDVRGGGILKPLRRSLDLLRRRSGSGDESDFSRGNAGVAGGGGGHVNGGNVNGAAAEEHKTAHFYDARKCFAGCRPTPRPPPARDPSTPTWAPSPKRTAPATPAVLLHGLGIGLPPYLWTVAHLLRARPDRPIALVCLPEVSLRAVFKVPSPDDLVDAVETLCRRHALFSPCLMGHSFGTFVVARACQRAKVAAAVLVDPVASCLMLPAVISRVIYQLEDRWRELWGLPPAGAVGGGARVSSSAVRDGDEDENESSSSFHRFPSSLGELDRSPSSSPSVSPSRLGVLHPRATWRHRADLVSRFLFTLARDWLVVRELSTAVALSRKFWWYRVCLWCEDMPRRSLVVLQSYDAILDPDAIAAHLLNRDAADVLWVEGFQHGELLGPQGYEARRRVANFLGALDTERLARDLIGLEPGAGRGQTKHAHKRARAANVWPKKGSPGAGAPAGAGGRPPRPPEASGNSGT